MLWLVQPIVQWPRQESTENGPFVTFPFIEWFDFYFIFIVKIILPIWYLTFNHILSSIDISLFIIAVYL